MNPIGSETVLVELGNGRLARYVITGKDRTCQRCGAPIWWTQTTNGKAMPVDEPNLGADMTTNHFGTCVNRSAREMR